MSDAVRHLGGEGETYINSLDADGVALAAIQGLYRRTEEQAARIEALEARLAALEQGPARAQGPGAAPGWLLLPGLAIAAGVWVQQRRAGGGR